MAKNNLAEKPKPIQAEALPEHRERAVPDLELIENKIVKIKDYIEKADSLLAWQINPESVKMPSDYNDPEKLAVANNNKLRTNWFSRCFELMQTLGEKLEINNSDAFALWAELRELLKEEGKVSKDEVDNSLTNYGIQILNDPKALAELAAQGKKKAAQQFVEQKTKFVVKFEKLLAHYLEALEQLKMRYEKDKEV